ncbi:MAG: hypothetical protein AAB495_03795 [Patescibacteria group bacterium]
MSQFFKNNPKLKKTIGVLLVLVGLLALATPFTPGSWLVVVGLELIGFRILFWDKIKARFRKKPSEGSDVI